MSGILAALPRPVHTGQEEDVRPLRNRRLAKFACSAQSVASGVLWVCLAFGFFWQWLPGRESINPLPIGVATLVSAVIVVVCGCLVLQRDKRFSERDYEPMPRTEPALERCRCESDLALMQAGFRRVGAYAVNGSIFYPLVELHLGCGQMVIAEFVSIEGKHSVELVSMTESGTVIVTTSEASRVTPALQKEGPFILVSSGGDMTFEALLKDHLATVEKAAEVADCVPVVFRPDDLVDVMKYYNRAYFDMRVHHQESKDAVGPRTYGRFRFPSGLIPRESPSR